MEARPPGEPGELHAQQQETGCLSIVFYLARLTDYPHVPSRGRPQVSVKGLMAAFAPCLAIGRIQTLLEREQVKSDSCCGQRYA